MIVHSGPTYLVLMRGGYSISEIKYFKDCASTDLNFLRDSPLGTRGEKRVGFVSGLVDKQGKTSR